jgi:uncharacterized Zn-finger protein
MRGLKVSNINKKIANAERVYEITSKDLPLCCPGDDMLLWNSHPRVYLSLDDKGESTCSYCGARYVMQKDSKLN